MHTGKETLVWTLFFLSVLDLGGWLMLTRVRCAAVALHSTIPRPTTPIQTRTRQGWTTGKGYSNASTSTSILGASTSTFRAKRRINTAANATVSTNTNTAKDDQEEQYEFVGDVIHRDGGGPNERVLAALRQAQQHELTRPDRDRYKLRSLNRAIKEIGYLDEALDAVPVGMKKGKGKEKVPELERIVEERVNAIKGLSVGIRKTIVKMIVNVTQSTEPEPLRTPSTSQRSLDLARRAAVSDLQSVPSIGLTTARHLVSCGIGSVEELRNVVFPSSNPSNTSSLKPDLDLNLTSAQLTHLRFYQHLIQPVTRSEVESVMKLVQELLPSGYRVIPTGAYRRGFPISGRVDLCLVHPLVKDVPKPQVGPPSGAGATLRSTSSSSESLDNSEDASYSDSDFDSVPTARARGRGRPRSSPSSPLSAEDPPTRRGRTDLFFRSLFIPAKARNESMLLNEVVPRLREGGLIAEGDMPTLTSNGGRRAKRKGVMGLGGDGMELGEFHKGEWKWTGVVRVPEKKESRIDRMRAIKAGEGVYRKLDLNLPPHPSLPSALLHLTGDSEFVREMKVRAKRMGLYLDEFGVWRWEASGANPPSQGADGNPIESDDLEKSTNENTHSGQWTLIPTPTEEILLDELGMAWISPERRNYTYLLSRYSKISGKARRGGDAEGPVGVVLNK
ncbi:hypothetical protein BT96DRAFT_1013045 [Gymnopus androsaceus JB14]|uniref:DNA-directed DNA polymerase X domain-containing protein n=1 Tax=Gymnopus androsaceus JB14 TaxID=1447944 RepID=A0A6A4IE77_9AGAR|nr:hypothetical protein BT96DRAFT_1013045 [Gymnopus androsaceus JB14]